jgi:hypothetical protein
LCLVLGAACASVSRDPSAVAFDRAAVVNTFVQWREGERRRDAAMAQEALHFERSGDRAFHRRELEALKGVHGGPIRTAIEFHLIGYPQPMGPGDYLFLEPAGRGYGATFVTIVAVGDEPRILYRRPALSHEQLKGLKPDEILRATVAHRIAFWNGLDAERLVEEVERTKRMLRYEVAAEAYADTNAVRLARFAPRPQAVLQSLEPLEPDEARRWIVATLEQARENG